MGQGSEVFKNFVANFVANQSRTANSGQAAVACSRSQILASERRLQPPCHFQLLVVGSMVGCAMVGNMGLQTFWEGLASGQWSDEQLRQFQAWFGETDLLASFDRAMRGGERAGLYAVLQHKPATAFYDLFVGGNAPGFGGFVQRMYHRAWPRGWIYQNEIRHHQLLQRAAFSNYDAGRHRVYPRKCEESVNLLAQAKAQWSPFAYLATVGTPNFVKAVEIVARTHTAANQAAMACALERYRRRHREYPASLSALAPEWIDRLPTDLMTGQPLHYSRWGEGKYLLYAVGWDGKDDGGTPERPLSSPGQPTPSTTGDWVWPIRN